MKGHRGEFFTFIAPAHRLRRPIGKESRRNGAADFFSPFPHCAGARRRNSAQWRNRRNRRKPLILYSPVEKEEENRQKSIAPAFWRNRRNGAIRKINGLERIRNFYGGR